MDKLDFTKIKDLCCSKDSIKQMKRQALGGQKTFAKMCLIKGLYAESVKNSTAQK